MQENSNCLVSLLPICNVFNLLLAREEGLVIPGDIEQDIQVSENQQIIFYINYFVLIIIDSCCSQPTSPYINGSRATRKRSSSHSGHTGLQSQRTQIVD